MFHIVDFPGELPIFQVCKWPFQNLRAVSRKKYRLEAEFTMGEPVTKQRKPDSPVTADQNLDQPLTNSKTPPPFQMKADPIQRQEAEGVTASPKEIEDKKKWLEDNPTILSPGEKFDANEPKMVAKTIAEKGYTKKVVINDEIKLCESKIYPGVNELCVPKIEAVNRAYEALKISDPATAAAIKNSIQKIGGIVPRVQKENFKNMNEELKPFGLKGYHKVLFSDHSLGCALDINERQGTKQNDHFAGDPKAGTKSELLHFAEKVIKEQGSADFNLDTTKGVALMEELKAFTEYYLSRFVGQWIATGDLLDLFGQDEKATLKTLKKLKGGGDKDARILVDNWKTLKGWSLGTTGPRIGKGKTKILGGPDKVDRGKSDKMDLLGMVDFHPVFLQMMLDAKWVWGGDFERTNKDFMHFEDRDAKAQMRG
jgi:hypothetical protein